MKLVVAAGGTAGHINPALSFVEKVLREQPNSEVIFVGREDGMEYRLVKEAGIRFFLLIYMDLREIFLCPGSHIIL